ncbi:conserved hypothetical protein (plasmid) [Deferribacter desulfuricans SSM1]|uniref:Radical SAM core domain-containing protein n=1 Tax=Deferribacter desulfuricans (strain DSM 14783 / JCM 11476 / NBRC 101012 / SSM1) TaxID=639282 RepID=D3PEY9_DEFDS|nr:radical SAM protein [Deferribacter desulfuricans]BAI81781.1 conserved hypothetical protein [Deferribacter desulfuricans SSM1]
MYIQITDICNFHCDHCAFSCSNNKGTLMDEKTFINSVKLADELYNYVTIGGGEPTLHPRFKQFVSYFLTRNIPYEEHSYNNSFETRRIPFIATNGSNKKLSLWLLSLATSGFINVALSLDIFHDISKVDPEVIDYFRQAAENNENNLSNITRVEIRDVSNSVKKVGRAIETGVWTQEGCACPDLFVTPKGDVKLCGCPDSPSLFNVNNKSDVSKFLQFINNNVNNTMIIDECTKYVKENYLNDYNRLLTLFNKNCDKNYNINYNINNELVL